MCGDYDRTSSITAMIKKLQWPSLGSRRLQTRLPMLYRIRFDLVDVKWRQSLQAATSVTRVHGSRFSDLHQLLLPHCPRTGTTFQYIQPAYS